MTRNWGLNTMVRHTASSGHTMFRTMFRNFFQRIKFRILARHLRRPRGPAGRKIGRWMNKANAFLYDATLAIMQPRPGESVLEIGYGNGMFFQKIISTYPRVQVSGIDYSPTMFAEATDTNRSLIREGKLELLQGSSDRLPFPANHFDHLFCINVIYFWDDPLSHLKELERVLKPGGRFYATVRSKESMQRMPFTRYGFHLYEREKWSALLQEAGMRLVAEHPIEDPPLEIDGQLIRAGSFCVVAEKIRG